MRGFAWASRLQAAPCVPIAAAASALVGWRKARSSHCESATPALSYDEWRRRADRLQDIAAADPHACGGRAEGRPLKVYVTGFGPFGSVRENPTSTICGWLTKRKAVLAKQGIDAVGVDIVEVSAEAARAKAEEIAVSLAETPRPVCVLHLGVATMNRRFGLECRAANLAHFSIPDVRGWVANNEPIVTGAPSHEYTALPLVELLCELRDTGVDMEISTNAGTYICNYIYFQSLTQAGKVGVPVLFVHTPSFETVPEEEQVRSIEQLLVALRRLADRGRF